MIGKAFFKATPRVLLAVAAFVFAAHPPCFASDTFGSALGSLVPLKTIESVCGPLFPCDGPGATMRSEFGIGIGGAQLSDAFLTGSGGQELDLTDAMNLDQGPLRIDAYVHLRYWRLGLWADYRNFEFKHRHRNLGKIDMSGPILAANFDLVQYDWVTFGIGAEYYFIEPRLQGAVTDSSRSFSNNTFTLDVKGERPITGGVYLRHMPPDVLGAPMYLEAWYKFPINQTKLTNFGVALVFRPQIYRFDVGCRILLERTNLRFFSPVIQTNNVIPPQHWEVRMQWDLIGVEFLAYF